MSPASPDSSTAPTSPIVVGIGASAGGLAALKTFFEGVPEDSGLAYVVVVHLSRDPQVFDRLAEAVIPRLFEGKSGKEYIRVWTVGCATGEEAYSFAILLLEEAARHEDPPQLQVFASDLHEQSLERAREGLYVGDIEADVRPDRLEKFFRKEDSGYRVRKEVRELVVFAPHNLLADPPFSRLDLIACRNLLIYLDREIQRDVVDLCHYALNPNGYLVLGTSETTDASELFSVVEKQHSIHKKRDVPPPSRGCRCFPSRRTGCSTTARRAGPASCRAGTTGLSTSASSSVTSRRAFWGARTTASSTSPSTPAATSPIPGAS